MSPSEHIGPYTAYGRFLALHETTCSGCPSHGMGDSSGNIWTTYNTTYNIENGCGSGFWGGFKSGLGGILGGVVGGLISGWLGNIGTCYWGGGGGSCGWNINQLTNPYLAIEQAWQGMQNNFGNFLPGAGNWFNPLSNNAVSGTTSDSTTKGSNKSTDKKTSDNGDKKSVDDLKKDVKELLGKDNITKDELQSMYDKLKQAKDNDNSSEIKDLEKQITDKAKEKNIELNTEDNAQNNTEKTSSENNSDKNNTNASNDSHSVDGASQQTTAGGNVTGNQNVDNPSETPEKTETTNAAQETTSTAGTAKTPEAGKIEELKNLGISEDNAVKLAQIGVKPSPAGNNTVTLPSVLSKANLLALKDALSGTNIYVAAANNPSAKGDKWIIGTIGDINGEDNNLEFSVDCAGSQPPNTLGFRYKVTKNNNNFTIDLYDNKAIAQAKTNGYGHKSRQYKFENNQLIYDDEQGGTVVSKTYKV